MAIAALHKYPEARLSLNVSGTTATDPRWYPQITEMLASNRGVTDRLIVEITETVALGDLQETLRFVEQLRELGCAVAIDDFGAGYTSFRNLRLLGVDMVKIDGSFIQNLGSQAEDELFVRTLIDLAKSFGITTVGEWVGDEKTAKILESAGVSYMQGYFFGAPELTKSAAAVLPRADQS